MKNRRPIFENPVIAASAVEALRRHSGKTQIPVYAYCIMPDHVHLIIGPTPDCDVVTFVGQYKNLAQRDIWQYGIKGRVWQKSFWDHFIRSDEHLEKAVVYVLNNPVRQGLVERWRDYPFCGSLVFNHEDLW